VSRCHSLADEQIDRVGLVRSKAAKPFGERLRRPILAAGESAHPQPPERPQLIFGVVKASRKFERPCPDRTGTRRTFRLHKRKAKRCIELHSAAQVYTGSRHEAGE
jgi:hypothetical protein